MIDLRSDTLTQPTPEMRRVMAEAPVGDDVLREDPTITRLEEQVAGLLGKQAALFVPSGTMGNQIGVRLHCQPGDEFLCETDCHIFYYEQAAYAQLFGVSPNTVRSPDGLLTPALLEGRIRGDDVHYPETKLLCLENTHNRHGGRVLPQSAVVDTCHWAANHGLARHLDGARIWNASIASGLAPAELAAPFDTVSVCFSKGLGAPVGSALVGPTNLIARARRLRKAMGGGMRQAGVIAAAALFAMEQHFERLSEDHENAQLLADAARQSPRLSLVENRCDTNLVMVDVDPGWGTAGDYAGELEKRGVQTFTMGDHKVRLVTHLGVTREEVEQAARTMLEIE